MEPRASTRNKSRIRSASPPTTHTTRPSIRSEKSYSDDWWTEQVREQQELSVGSRHDRPLDFSMHEAERMDPDGENHHDPTMPISGLLRRDHSSIGATSSTWNRYLEDHSSLPDQDTTAVTFLGSTITIADGEESQSEYGSEQENQPPFEFPASPPNEPTYHRLQRQPLKQLKTDRNGNLLTPASLAEHSASFAERMFASSSQIDEDEELDSDVDSNASTIVLPNTRKRNVGVIEDEERHHNHLENENLNSRHTKRLKTLSRSKRVDSAGTDLNNMHTAANFAPEIALTYTTPFGEDLIDYSESESTASTIMPSPRKQEKNWRPQIRLKNRRRASSTGALSPGSHELGNLGLHRRSEERRNLSMPALGRSRNELGLGALYLFSNHDPVHSTPVRPQNRYNDRRLPAHRVWLPTPAKTPVAVSTRHLVAESESNSMDVVLTRLEAAEDRFTGWLTEVRDKKGRCRRLLDQQKEDQRAMKEDLARLRQLEPLIQTMATKELNEINENIRVHEGDADKLSLQRKEIRRQLLGFEKLRHNFEEERLTEA